MMMTTTPNGPQDPRVPPDGAVDVDNQIEEFRRLLRTGERRNAINLLWDKLCGPLYFRQGNIGRFGPLLFEAVHDPVSGSRLPLETDQDVKACTLLANCWRLMGPAAEAARLHQEVVAWDEIYARERPALRALHLDLLGLDLLTTGDYLRAENCFRESLTLSEEAHSRESDVARRAAILANVVTAHRDLAALYTATGQWQLTAGELNRAQDTLREAESRYRETACEEYQHSVLGYWASVWIGTADAALRLGAITDARLAIEQAITHLGTNNRGRERIDADVRQGLIFLRSGQPHAANWSLRAALGGAERLGRAECVARATLARSELLQAENITLARALAQKALVIAIDSDYVGLEAEIHLALARLWQDEGDNRSHEHAKLAALRSKQRKDPSTREYVLNAPSDHSPWCDATTLARAELLVLTGRA
jgi:tetratricopeptide (TPR) repeat protein